jgi:TPR repeat protein
MRTCLHARLRKPFGETLFFSVALALGCCLLPQPRSVAQTNSPTLSSMTFQQIKATWSSLSSEELGKAADAGEPSAQFYLATLKFEHAEAVRTESFQWLLKASGDSMESPKAEAVRAKWGNASEAEARRAANSGDHEAQQLLGTLINEKALDDERQGVEWLKRAAQGSLLIAQNELAWAYRKGLRGLPRDVVRAQQLFRAAAGSGFESSQHRLAQMLIEGDGVPCDLAEGIEWLRKAADQGCARARFDLARQYSCGNGEPRNTDETPVALFAKAAKAGLAEAQLALAERYRTGLGVTRDAIKAFFWYSMAARQGLDLAAQQRDRLKPSLTETDQQQVRTWIEDFDTSQKMP